MSKSGNTGNSRNINYAAVAAFERSKELKAKGSGMHVLSLVLMAVFFVVLMVGLAAGVGIYRQVADAQAQTNQLQMQSGIISNIVHMNDVGGAISEGEGPEGPSIVLEEKLDSGTYETRLYLSEGYLVQEYAIAGRDYNPQGAQKLLQTQTFDFSIDGKLLTVQTDLGSVNVTVRSDQADEVDSAEAETSGAASSAAASGTTGAASSASASSASGASASTEGGAR